MVFLLVGGCFDRTQTTYAQLRTVSVLDGRYTEVHARHLGPPTPAFDAAPDAPLLGRPRAERAPRGHLADTPARRRSAAQPRVPRRLDLGRGGRLPARRRERVAAAVARRRGGAGGLAGAAHGRRGKRH